MEKPILRFSGSRTFRILCLSDFQEGLDCDPRTLAAMNALLEETTPDLLLLVGDNIDHHKIHTAQELKEYLSMLTAYPESHGIPWAHVFGNHDHDCDVNDAVQATIYESFPHCISGHSAGIHGTTNYFLPVYAADSDDIVFGVWALDSNNQSSDYFRDCGIARQSVGKGLLDFLSDFDTIRADQVAWYIAKSSELTASCGHPVPSLMAMHIPLQQSAVLQRDPQTYGVVGDLDEAIGGQIADTGMMAAILEQKDVRAVVWGHSHNDNYVGSYGGVLLAFDGSIGFSPYGKPERKGGRLFEIDADDPRRVTTRMLFVRDKIDITKK